MGVDKSTGAELRRLHVGEPTPSWAPTSPGRCRLRARSRFMQRSGSCSVVSEGSPSSTMLSRNWAKGVPKCSGRGANRSLQSYPFPTPPSFLAFVSWEHSIPARLWYTDSQAFGPWVLPLQPVISWSNICILTIVCIGHCLPHGEDHGQDESGVTELLVV